MGRKKTRPTKNGCVVCHRRAACKTAKGVAPLSEENVIWRWAEKPSGRQLIPYPVREDLTTRLTPDTFYLTPPPSCFVLLIMLLHRILCILHCFFCPQLLNVIQVKYCTTRGDVDRPSTCGRPNVTKKTRLEGATIVHRSSARGNVHTFFILRVN